MMSDVIPANVLNGHKRQNDILYFDLHSEYSPCAEFAPNLRRGVIYAHPERGGVPRGGGG